MKTLYKKSWKYRSFKAMLEKCLEGGVVKNLYMQDCAVRDIPQSASPIIRYENDHVDKQILGLPLYWRTKKQRTYLLGYELVSSHVEGCLFAFVQAKKKKR